MTRPRECGARTDFSKSAAEDVGRRLRITNFVTTRYLVSVRWPSSFRLANRRNGTRSRGSTLTISHLEQSPTKITPSANSGEHLGGFTYQNERATNYTAQKRCYKSDLANKSTLMLKICESGCLWTYAQLSMNTAPHQNMLTLHFKWSQLIRLQTNPPLFGQCYSAREWVTRREVPVKTKGGFKGWGAYNSRVTWLRKLWGEKKQ